MFDSVDEWQDCMPGDGIGVMFHISQVIKFKRINWSLYEYHSTNQVLLILSRSARNDKNILLNISIKIPIKSKHNHASLSPSPNHRKKYKIVPSPYP